MGPTRRNPETGRSLLWIAAGEAMLIVVAAPLAWWFEEPLARRILPSEGLPQDLLIGLVATGPMLAVLAWLLRTRIRPLVRFRRQTVRLVGVVFGGASVAQIVFLALMAGVSEELLFRGVLQPVLGRWLSPWGGVAAASVLFGLAHPMSWAYVVAAALAGFYLGALVLVTDQLVSAIVAHAVYDAVALFWLTHGRDRHSA